MVTAARSHTHKHIYQRAITTMYLLQILLYLYYVCASTLSYTQLKHTYCYRDLMICIFFFFVLFRLSRLAAGALSTTCGHNINSARIFIIIFLFINYYHYYCYYDCVAGFIRCDNKLDDKHLHHISTKEDNRACDVQRNLVVFSLYSLCVRVSEFLLLFII